VLNLFYEEPDRDRWLPFDRYPRRIVRRVLRGKSVIGGHKRVFLNLCAGLDCLGVRYRVNDYGHARRNPNELVCIVGKAHVLDKMKWQNPILFGAAVFSHPLDDPHLFERLPVKKVLLPGAWMKEMWRPHWEEPIVVWPVGIDTDRWRPADATQKRFDVLLYDKVRWDHAHYETTLIEPIRRKLRDSGRTFRDIRYSFYREEQFHAALAECRAMIFLCEHETQGIAYQQALAAGVPILAWDRGGYWQDPAYFPAKVKFQPVTSVPYWDERCGRTFAAIEEFDDAWRRLWDEFQSGHYDPRAYILENLTLEKCARQYLLQVRSLSGDRACDVR
jgi:glycosyltransferase involved in cell wall biosynthesis